jgi:hypothetical protein
MKQRILQSIFFLLATTTSLWAQPFRTPTFTGNAFTDFTAAERSTFLGDLAYEVTWDATNIYLGVSASSSYAKDQPNLFYFDTDPTDNPMAGTGSSVGQNYDGRIGMLPFKANVVVYMKNGYAEMRVWDGAFWATYYDVTANTFYGTNDIELSLPWANFGGRPAAMRYLMFKENGGGGTDAYSIFPNGTAPISGGTAPSYIGDLNTTAFNAAQYVYIANTNSGAHTANTTISDCPTFTLSGSTCLPLTLTTAQNTGNNTYSVTLNNATTAQNFNYSISNTGAAATGYTNNFSFQPSSTTPLPAGTYTVGSVTLGSATASGASPFSCPNAFAGTGSVMINQSAPTPSGVTGTNPTGASNGNLTIGGLTSSVGYGVSYQLNGGAVTTVTGLTSTGAGALVVPNLGAGIYTNIKPILTSSTCGALSPLGPVTLTTSCPAAAGTFPW